MYVGSFIGLFALASVITFISLGVTSSLVVLEARNYSSSFNYSEFLSICVLTAMSAILLGLFIHLSVLPRR